jgi:TrmH family RNA methyltransferase
VRQLADARQRREAQQCLVEGVRAISACLVSGWVPTHLFMSEGHELPALWTPFAVTQVSARVGAKLSQASSPSGYVAVFPIPPLPPVDLAAGGLLLFGMHDPGNLGTLIRCAAAFALPQVVLIGGADPYAHKVIQATAGTFTATHIYRYDNEQSAPAFTTGAPGCALVVRGGVHPGSLAPGRRWLMVGSEAHGLPPSLLAACHEHVTLPMPGHTESLNAAMAGAIACYALFAPGPQP